MNAVALDIQKIRQDFPILHQEVHGYPLVYLDSAATSQKPKSVIEALSRYYLETNANVHRGIHTLSELATSQFEATRSHVAHFIGGVANEEVIYTRGTTESINLVAQAWGDLNIQTGDRIVITEMEHHANFVPWLRLAKRKNAEIVYIPITGDGLLDLAEAEKLITPNTKLVAFTHMSNVLGTINPVGALTELAHKQGALVMVDGAQSVPHLQVDVHELDVDFYAFSAHKMLGPTGVGILYGKQQHLEAMEPYQTGGEMIHMVSFTDVSWADLPWKFEAGTPNIGDVVAFKSALDYLDEISMESIRQHEIEITQYAMDSLKATGVITIYGPEDVSLRGGAVSFVVDGVHSHDLSTILDTQGVAIRAGHHCAQPLHSRLGVNSTSRASFYIYNTLDEVDRLVDAILQARRYFVRG